MDQRLTFLVLGATGGTGQHFVSQVLADGHRVRALARTPGKLAAAAGLDVRPGSITAALDLDDLFAGVDAVVAMLGDWQAQRHAAMNAAFVAKLIPAMRRQGVKRFLYQAGGLSRPPGGGLSPVLWIIRHTLARGFDGQHRDNEAVMAYLATQANDLEWMVHRAAIGSVGATKGVLARSDMSFSIATFRACAAYNYRTVTDDAAVRTCSFSRYAQG